MFVKDNIFLAVPNQFLCEGPCLSVIGGAMISEQYFQSQIFELVDFPDFFGSKNERKLVGFELVFVLYDEKIIALSLEQVNGGVDLLVCVHIFDLDHKHKPVDFNSLLSENVGLGIVRGGSFGVNEENLLGLFLRLFMVPVQKQRAPVDHLSVINQGRNRFRVGETIKQVGFIAAKLLKFLDLVGRFFLVGFCSLHTQLHARHAHHCCQIY